MKTIIARSCAIIFASILVGCGGGGGGSATAPENTTTTYRVTNATPSDFKSISVLDASTGNINQTGDINCASQSKDCTFYYTGPAIAGQDILVFKDSAGAFVAAYVSAFSPSSDQSVFVSDWSTGVYLYKKLNETNQTIAKMSQGDMEARLYSFTANYDSPDGAPDYYQEIAFYYAYERETNKLSVTDFLSRFGVRLEGGEVALASEFRNALIASGPLSSIQMAINNLFTGRTSIIKSAHAQTANSGVSCPAGLSSFLTVSGAVAGAVSNVFPIASGVGSVTSAFASEVCGTGEVSNAELMNKLNQIQLSLDQLHDNLSKLTDLVSDNEISLILAKFLTISKVAYSNGDSYKSLVDGSNTSLLQYLQSNKRTLQEELAMYPSGNVAILMNATFNSGGLVGLIDELNDLTLTTLVKNLNAKCQSITEGDIVSKRIQCNLAISTSMGRLLGSQELALKIAKDAYEVALDPANIVDAKARYPGGWLNTDQPPRLFTVAEKTTSLKTKFETQLSKAKNKFQDNITNAELGADGQPAKGYFNAFDGISRPLRNTMDTINCKNVKLNVTAITSWVKESNQNTEWIETECQTASYLKSPTAKARYFIKLNAGDVGYTEVGNVMGVLVPKRIMSQGSTGGLIDYVPGQYGYSGTMFDPIIAFKIGTESPQNKTFLINNTDYRTSEIKGPQVGVIPRALRKISDQAVGLPQGTSLWYIDYYGTSVSMGGSATSYVRNWIRYTDDSGYSNVFVLASGGSGSQYVYSYCVTYDCTITQASNSLNQPAFNFVKGPQNLKLAESNSAYAQVPQVNTAYQPGTSKRPMEWNGMQ
jgi:hypothetical protein